MNLVFVVVVRNIKNVVLISEVKMTKQEWLEEQIFVDIFGRQYNLSDVPMTYMTRKEAFEKRGYGKKMIKQLWKETVAEIRGSN